ncbi:MAG TPA: hypothetical protein VMF35_09245 [Acidimicrobiales bacterium]|nr:hypothetical protein [Acidimicrobiales bacterium]
MRGVLCLPIAIVLALFVASPAGAPGAWTSAGSVTASLPAAHLADAQRVDASAARSGTGTATDDGTSPDCAVVTMPLSTDTQLPAGAQGVGPGTCLPPARRSLGVSTAGTLAMPGEGDSSSATIAGAGSASVSQTIGITISPGPSLP